MTYQKKNNIRFKEIITLAFGTGFLFFLTIFALIATALVTLLIPLSFRLLIDDGIGQNGNTAFIVAAIMACLLAGGTALRYYCVSLVGERIFKALRQKFFDHIMLFSPYETDNFRKGDLMSRLVADAEVIRSFSGSSLSVAARNILLLFGGLFMMFLTDSTLSLIALGIIPIVIIPVLFLGRILKQKSKIAQARLSEANSRADEIFHALETVQNFNRESYEKAFFSDKAEASYAASKERITSRAFLTYVVILLVFLGVVGVLWYGSLSVNNGIMTAGTLAQFLLYTIFTAGAASSLSEVWGELQKASSAYDRITEIFHVLPKIKSNNITSSQSLSGHITLKDLSFSYKEGAQKILSNISLTIHAGQKVAFVGKSGAGKTTIFKLLLNQRLASSGHIYFDHQDISSFDPSFIRSQVAYVSQDVTLFSGTIFDNIAYGQENATKEDIIKAAKQAYLHDFIMSLPEGYHTDIGEKGTELSGGQKQRLTIARAFIKNAPILLLDEATAALDMESEGYITSALEALSHGKTVISIAHRFATVKNADMIFVFDKGTLIESGTHTELSDAGNTYSDLATKQFV